MFSLASPALTGCPAKILRNCATQSLMPGFRFTQMD
jgi:hypothetical protein